MSVGHRLSAALVERYRIERELGEGGMANVYLAEDLKHKRKVALKVLKPELAAVLGADRFVQVMIFAGLIVALAYLLEKYDRSPHANWAPVVVDVPVHKPF